MKPILALAACLCAIGAATASAQSMRPCRTADLRVTEGMSQGAAGSFFVTLDLRNASGHSCRTGGFPGIDLIDAHGRRMHAAASDEGAPHALTIGAGRFAHVVLRYVEIPFGATNSGCRHVSAVRFIAPLDTRALRAHLPHGSVACAAPGKPPDVTVRPIARGR